MPQSLLGKRLRSHDHDVSPLSRSTINNTTRHSLPSPEPTPKPKRVRLSTPEGHDDESNKENIPPVSPLSLPSSTDEDATAATTRALQASRRATMPTLLLETPRRRVSSTAAACTAFSTPPVVSSSLEEVQTSAKRLPRFAFASPPATPDSAAPPPVIQLRVSPTVEPIHAVARNLLHTQNHNEHPLVGRETERAQILEFLEPFLAGRASHGDPTSLYISGAPGTGKTALLNEILTTVRGDASVCVWYFNCASLGSSGSVDNVWETCVRDLGLANNADGGADGLEGTEKSIDERKCILVLDEIDHVTAKPSGIHEAFALPNAHRFRANLRIIGISNIHTLADSKISSSTRTIHFKPYTAVQMKAILTARLASLPVDNALADVFPLPTITFLSTKVASQTGDIRTLFSVARRALDLAIKSAPSSNSETLPPLSPAHILRALKACQTTNNDRSQGTTEVITRVRNLGLQHRFVLTALLFASKRLFAGLGISGSASFGRLETDNNPTINFAALHSFYSTMLSRGTNSAFTTVNRTEFKDLLNILEGHGLVQIVNAHGKLKPKHATAQLVSIASGVREEEIIRGLIGSQSGETSTSVNVQEEEIRLIWKQEAARLEREKGVRAVTMIQSEDHFENASKD